jgi:uncharacterized protein (TIGR04551 family)
MRHLSTNRRAGHRPTPPSQIATLAMISTLFVSTTAWAGDFSEVGDDFDEFRESVIQVNGYFRARGEALYNLDLDRGLTPSGRAIFQTPIDDPTAQTLTWADMRLRTDIAAYSPVGDVAVKARVDALDNVGFGTMPDGPPQTTASQTAGVFSVKRAWGEVLTPVGLLSVGRMGSDWGLGMLTNSGDCRQCNSGDAADRVAFVTPVLGHIFALAYDIGFVGPTHERANNRAIDFATSDDVRGATFAMMRYDTEASRTRRGNAGKPTFNYGAFVSYRWQDTDIPASYAPTAQPVPIDSSQVVQRGSKALASDLWLRLDLPKARFEAEMALLWGSIKNGSLIPGVTVPQELTSLQWGGALESHVEVVKALTVGLDLGAASGDSAPGFGARPDPFGDAPEPGDLDGIQASLPRDTTVDNFRFHPDYRVDQILFSEIIGTVTDVVYVRPHVAWTLAEFNKRELRFSIAGIVSQAIEPTSTPGGEAFLGVELDPSLTWESPGFSMAFDYAVFFPGAGFDNVSDGLSAKAAQLGRVSVWMEF